MIITTASINDLRELSELHKICFPDYYLTSLGRKLLANFYKEIIVSDGEFVLIARNDSGMAVGLIAGRKPNSLSQNNFEKNNFLRISFTMLVRCLLLDKRSYSRIWTRIKSKFIKKPNKKQEKENNNKCYSLLSICVHPDYRGSVFGISKSLLEAFENNVIKLGGDSYKLCVFKSNIGGVKYYQKNGMSISRETDDVFVYGKQLFADKI